MSIYPEKRNGKLTGTFLVEHMDMGKRLRARAKTMQEAKAIERQMERGLYEAEPVQKPRGRTLHELLLEAKVKRPKRKNSWRSVGEIEYCIGLLGRDTEIETITSRSLRALGERIVSERGCTNATANRYVHALMGLFSWARKADLMVRAPVYEKLDEGASKRLRWLSEDQEAQVVAWLLDNGRHIEAGLVRILGQTGLRSGELLSIRAEQIDVRSAVLTLLDQKDDTGQEGIPVTREQAEWLLANVHHLPTKQVLLKWFKRACVACGFPVGRGKDGLVIHSLRHSTATRLIRGGVNPAEVQSYMRHKSWATTQRYVKVTGEQKRKALETLRTAGQTVRGNSGQTSEIVAPLENSIVENQEVGAQGRNRTTDTAIFSLSPKRP